MEKKKGNLNVPTQMNVRAVSAPVYHILKLFLEYSQQESLHYYETYEYFLK